MHLREGAVKEERSPHIRKPLHRQRLRVAEEGVLSELEQMPSGDLHAEAGPNPKLNPRSCANKEEIGKSLPAASGTAD